MIAVCGLQGLLSLPDGAAWIKGEPRQSNHWTSKLHKLGDRRNNKFWSAAHHFRRNFCQNFEVHWESGLGWRGHYQSVKVGWRPAIKWQLVTVTPAGLLPAPVHRLLHLHPVQRHRASCCWCTELPLWLVSQMYTFTQFQRNCEICSSWRTTLHQNLN